MAMVKADIQQMIAAALPHSEVNIIDLAGDGDHYEVRVKSSAFQNKSRIEQHQMVYAALEGKVGQELHALSIKTLVT